MKKLFSIVLIAVAFGLVGCSAEKGVSNLPDESVPPVKHKCKGHKCHSHGKLGDERMTNDTSK